MKRVAGPKVAETFEIRHLRYFVVLAEEQNFARAAERLGIAQPGLSQQIMKLESIVKTPLLDRTQRLMKLTLAGEVFLEEARKTLNAAESALVAVTKAGRGETGRISIGYVASVAYAGVLTRSIASFRKAHPDVELQLVEMEMGEQLARISEGRLDFGFIRPPTPLPPNVVTRVILKERLVVALPDDDALAGTGAVDLADLADREFITPRQAPDVGFRRNTTTACEEAGISPVIRPIGRDFTTIASMVAVGLGIALVPKSLDCLRLPGVRYRNIRGVHTTSELAIAHRKSELSAAVRAFITHNRSATFTAEAWE
ncbi:LysR family transcriptional regulator [Ancylobacter amanitiformis]|uniref:DNA-binding transcriptional LysR family regulator n=1 Tax=Ancylobacter amanitiformis TaxID=217069 RepID=A0ABU0LT45_9HYPH|nr:LysR family transcriptional regulator [Ancylobacter amanitiformis]MDQ0511883.1 DNA-binding transcriptional LysR family regulator [Ancylobacter amanitiformis]